MGPSPSRDWINSHLKDFIKKYCPSKDARILDIGCGKGEYSMYFPELRISGQYLGIDANPREEWHNPDSPSDLEVSFNIHDAHHLERIGRSFNFILSITSLEHMEDDAKVMKGVSSILEDGSYALIIVPNFYAMVLYPWHGKYYSVRRFDSILDDSLETVERVDICGFPSFILHFFWIIFPIGLRKLFLLIFGRKSNSRKDGETYDLRYFENVYSFLLKLCRKYDSYLPFWPAHYMFVITKRGARKDTVDSI